MPGHPPLDPATLVTRAKAKATPVVSCVTSRLPPARLLWECSWLDLYALVLVLAESADHAKLRAVVSATEDSEPVSLRDVQLRKAHAEVARLRREDMHVPAELLLLESEYQAQSWRARQMNAQRATRGAEPGAA